MITPLQKFTELIETIVSTSTEQGMDELFKEQGMIDSLKECIANYAYFIRDIFDDTDDDVTTLFNTNANRLESARGAVTESFSTLGQRKLAIFQGPLAKFVHIIESVQNISLNDIANINEFANYPVSHENLSHLHENISEAPAAIAYINGGAATQWKETIIAEMRDSGEDNEFISDLFQNLKFDELVDAANKGKGKFLQTLVLHGWNHAYDFDDDDTKKLFCWFVSSLNDALVAANGAAVDIGIYGTNGSPSLTIANDGDELLALTTTFLEGRPLVADMIGKRAIVLGEHVSDATMTILSHVMGVEFDDKDDKKGIDFYFAFVHGSCTTEETKKQAFNTLFETSPTLVMRDIELALACNNPSKVELINKQIEQLITNCKAIHEYANSFADLLGKLEKILVASLAKFEALTELMGTDYHEYPQQAKQALINLIAIAQATQAMLETPILDAKGVITNESRQVYECVENSLSNL